MLRLLLSIWLGKLIFAITRILKIGGGSAAPGLYALKVEPQLISKLIRQIPQNIIITGTNGKTTTSRILNHLVKYQKIKTIRNSTGSNLERGIASSLIKHSNIFGQIKDVDIGIWELDEAAFNKVVFQAKPEIIVFLNAFRDQLDRYGEVDSVVSKWKSALEKIDWNPKVIINGSDANTQKLIDRQKDQTIFGIPSLGTVGEKSYESKKVDFDIKAEKISTIGLDGVKFSVVNNHQSIIINLPLPGVYHIYDFLAAFSTYFNLNLPLDNINSALQNFSPAFGRVERINIRESEAYIFLIKNPAGASLVFETVSPEIKSGDTLYLALNDNFADGTDVSWIWDAAFERFKKQEARSKIIVSGTRAYDLALRLKYAGVDENKITVEPDLEKALNLAKESQRMFILPTYTAMLELQKIIASQGHKTHYWKEEG